jgi:hypothetical protein
MLGYIRTRGEDTYWLCSVKRISPCQFIADSQGRALFQITGTWNLHYRSDLDLKRYEWLVAMAWYLYVATILESD